MNFNMQNPNGFNRGPQAFQNNQPRQTQNGTNFDPGYYPPPNTFMGPLLISGRVIQNANEVRPNEVPMDGTCSFFPMYDGSAIYVKCWSPDGSSIITQRFAPDSQNGNQPKTP